MKGTFKKDIYTMKLDETLKNHKPYAVLVVSTTGLDTKDFKDHSPTRVVLKQYEYDDELKAYKINLSFDKMVEASKEAVQKALENTNYDAFANGGIDKIAYQQGKDVLSKKDFTAEFGRIMEALKSDDTLLIANNLEHSTKYLDKINAADILKTMSVNGKTLDQVSLTKEYLNASKGSSLEDLRNAMRPHPKLSFAQDENLMKDFKSMSRDDFLKAHTDITNRAYDVTEADSALREAKIVGGDARIDVINQYIIKHGTEAKIFESDYMRHLRESEAAKSEQFSESGKAKYQAGSLQEKFDTLIEQGTLSPDKILNGDSEFHKLIEAVESTNNKGIVIIHAASTGFEFNKPLPQKTGQPIQFTALAFTRGKDGLIDFSTNPKGMNITIQAPTKSILLAEKNINDPKRPYDTFKETGIDLEQYKAKVGVVSQDEAVRKTESFFKMFPASDYPIIAIGGTNGSDKSFTQVCMSNLASFEMCDAPYIDFAQVIKDYTYLAANDSKYPENVMFSEDAISGKKFGIQDVAAARGEDAINSTLKKCQFVVTMIELLEQQQAELFRQAPVQSKQQDTVSQPSNENKQSSVNLPESKGDTENKGNGQGGNTSVATANKIAAIHSEDVSAPAPVEMNNMDDAEGMFADENDDYDNVTTEEEVEAERQKEQKKTESDLINDYMTEIENDIASPIQQTPVTSQSSEQRSRGRTSSPLTGWNNLKSNVDHSEDGLKLRDGNRYAVAPDERRSEPAPSQEIRSFRRHEEPVQTSTSLRSSEDRPMPRRRIVSEPAHSMSEQTTPVINDNSAKLLEQAMKTIAQQGEQIKTLTEQIANSNNQMMQMLTQSQAVTTQQMDMMQKYAEALQEINRLTKENAELREELAAQKELQSKSRGTVTTRVS